MVFYTGHFGYDQHTPLSNVLGRKIYMFRISCYIALLSQIVLLLEPGFIVMFMVVSCYLLVDVIMVRNYAVINYLVVYWYFKSMLNQFESYTLHKKCPYSGFFWSVFSRIRTEYEEIRTRKTPNTVTFHAVILMFRDYPLSTYAKFSEKLQRVRNVSFSENFACVLNA